MKTGLTLRQVERAAEFRLCVKGGLAWSDFFNARVDDDALVVGRWDGGIAPDPGVVDQRVESARLFILAGQANVDRHPAQPALERLGVTAAGDYTFTNGLCIQARLFRNLVKASDSLAAFRYPYIECVVAVVRRGAVVAVVAPMVTKVDASAWPTWSWELVRDKLQARPGPEVKVTGQ